jgi:hypothetical protein
MSKSTINAVLVRLSISVFPNTRQDPDITAEVKLKRALGQGAGKWVKYKLPDESLVPIRKFAGIVRQFHYDHTCVWEDGQQLLSAKARPGYDAKMQEFSEEFWKLVDAFGEEYPNWIEQAKIMHAGTFDPSDYPEWSRARGLFRFTREYMPVPKAEHFNKDMQELYGAGLNALVEKKISDAVSDAWERLFKPVQLMAEKLASPDAIFRDSLVENIRDVVQLIPELNITDNPKLIEAAKLIQKDLASLDPNVLRDSKVDRKEAAEKAANIVALFSNVGKRKLAA